MEATKNEACTGQGQFRVNLTPGDKTSASSMTECAPSIEGIIPQSNIADDPILLSDDEDDDTPLL